MTVPAKDPARFAETRIEDQTVVMALESGDFFALEGTAETIWELIDGTRDRAAILAALGERYDAPAQTLAGDLDRFLGELAAAGLLAPG